MIPRYTRPDMARIWEPANRFRIWFEIEAHATEAMEELGIVPKGTGAAVRKGGKPYTPERIARIDAIEQTTKHDVLAFLTELAEHLGPESRFVHQGMTSSDVLDTCFAVQLTQASDLLLKDVDAVLAALKKRAFEHKLTPTIGRSHGIHAEPGRRSRPAPSLARSAASPASIRASKPMSRPSSASPWSRCRPR